MLNEQHFIIFYRPITTRSMADVAWNINQQKILVMHIEHRTCISYSFAFWLSFHTSNRITTYIVLPFGLRGLNYDNFTIVSVCPPPLSVCTDIIHQQYHNSLSIYVFFFCFNSILIMIWIFYISNLCVCYYVSLI